MQSRLRAIISSLKQWFGRARLMLGGRETNIIQWYRQARIYGRAHQSLIALTIFILVNNAIVVQASQNTPDLPEDVIVSDPYQIADTLRLLADYTPNIEEDPDAIALTLEERINGTYISTNPLIATLPGDLEPSPTPTPQVVQREEPEERTKDVTYVVKIGDTLSGIGSRFDLKVATIKIKNKISDVDSIKPGQELIIPAQDLSDKAVAAAQERQKASSQLTKSTGTSAVVTSRSAGLVAPIRHNGVSRRLVGGHTGVDYRANVGTPVYAAADGVIVVASGGGWNGGYGINVLEDMGGGKTLRYAHMSRLTVGVGQRVKQGQVIGYSGNSGRSTGPHLHFELRINGRAVDPGV